MIRLRVLGGIELQDPHGRPVHAVLAQPKRLAVLTWLALAPPPGFHRRDTLLALFWPELDTQRARGALNQAVYHLRRALGQGVVTSRGRDELAVDGGRLWCDASAFEVALDGGRCRDALELYRGDLLAGFYIPDAPDWERWVDDERRRLRGRAAAAAWSVAEASAAAGNAVDAAWWGRRSVALSPGDEPQLRRLIWLLAGVGDRIGALRAWHDTLAEWDLEPDTAPSAETAALLSSLRGGAAPALTTGTEVLAPAAVRPAEPSDLTRTSNATGGQRPPPGARTDASAGAAAAAAGGMPSWKRRRTAAVVVTLIGVSAWLLTRSQESAADAPPSTVTHDSDHAPAVDPAARADYERGRLLLARLDATSFSAARDHFERALEVEPTFAAAWSGLAEAFIQLTSLMVLPPAEGYPRARAAAERALTHDPSFAEAHATLGMALAMYYWDTPSAEQHLRRAVELDPTSARSRRMYASHLRNLGRFDEALAQIREAQVLDPFFAFARVEEAIILHVSGRNEEALRVLRQYLVVEPDDAHAYVFMAMAHERLGQFDEALAALASTDPHGNRPDAQTIRGVVYARSGDVARARAMLITLDSLAAAGRPVSPFHKAAIHVTLGEHERALDLLEQAVDRPTMQLRMLGVKQTWDPLREHPRFQALLARVGLR